MNSVIMFATNVAAKTPFDEHLDAIVTVIITIIGFVVTITMTKKSFKNEIKKSKIALASEETRTLPYDICQLLDDIMNNDQNEKVLERYRIILSKVLAYGSSQAVKITIRMQKMIYDSEKASINDDKTSMFAAYSLLITQLKYDLTSVIISPESWLQLRIKDYEINKAKICQSINNLIKELDLNNDFKV